MADQTKKHRILVIDDDQGMIHLMGSVLSGKGYEVVLADEAPRGLELAMKQPPDLVVLDVMMPIINGYNICRLLKSEQTHKHIPIILLTSRASEEDRKIGIEVGADAYLAKPVNTEVFLSKIRELLKIA